MWQTQEKGWEKGVSLELLFLQEKLLYDKKWEIQRHLFVTQASSTEGNNATTEKIVKKWKGIAMINKDLKGLMDLSINTWYWY